MIVPIIQNPDYSVCELRCDICKRQSKTYIDIKNVFKENRQFDMKTGMYQTEYVLLVSCAYCPRIMSVNVSQA